MTIDDEITRQYIERLQSQLAAARAEIGNLKDALHDAEAIGDFSEELRDRRRLQEAANCVPKLQEELAASQKRERILREGLEKIISLDDDDSRWPSEVTDYEQGVISGIEEAADIARDTFKAAAGVK